MKWNSKKILLMICVGLTGSALFSFNKGDDRNFHMVLMLCWRRPTLTRSIILKKIIH